MASDHEQTERSRRHLREQVRALSVTGPRSIWRRWSSRRGTPGVLPSARFGANAAWFRINALTFNVLSVLKRRALPERFRDARPKRLRYELFTLAGELAVHQSQLSVRVPVGDQRLQEIVDARGRLLAMYAERRRASLPWHPAHQPPARCHPAPGPRRASASAGLPEGAGTGS